MNIELSDHFTYKKLIRFSLSPISSMVFTSLYTIVDGYFVSNFVGATPFAALNLVWPFIMLVAGAGFMFGSGGSALVALHLGMKEDEKANRYFSLIVYTTLVLGIILGALGFIFAKGVSLLMGSTQDMLPFCIIYLRVMMVGIPFFMLQNLFQTFLIAAEHPQLGFRITLIAGVTNMILDWLFVGMLKFGLAGAAWATIIAQMVGAIIPLILFIVKRNWNIRLGKTRFELHVLTRTCGNGISEFLSNISMAIIGMLFNLQLLKFAGENGVSAYGVIAYVSFIFVAIYIGYTMGVSPVVSYNDGARNTDELKSLYSKSLRMIFFANIIMTIVSFATAGLLAKVFVGYDPELLAMTARGMRIYSIAFLFMGFNFFGSAFFTALNNGKISAILSVSRTLIIQLVMMYFLPIIWGIDGLWAVVIVVEIVALFMTVAFLMKNGKRYGYR